MTAQPHGRRGLAPALAFGVACVGLKFGIELFALDWEGAGGLVRAVRPAFDLLGFLPACVILFSGVDPLPRVARAAALVAALAAIDAVVLADVLSLEFFHAHFTSVLGVLLRTHALTATGSNLREILPWGALAACAVFSAAAVTAFRRRTSLSPSLLAASLLVLAGYVAAANRESAVQASLDLASGETIEYEEGAGDRVADKPLHAARHMAAQVRGEARFAPKTIVVLINESCPWQFQSTDRGIPLFDKVVSESGLEASKWEIFRHAFTNSSTTDISMPSIMTGSDPTAGTAAVERLPFIYDMAKLRGYTTGFFTSQDYGWAALRPYFSSASLDEFISSEITGQKNANLLGIDDMYIARRAANFIRAKGRDGRLFLVINNNALHVPFQTQSAVDIPGSITEPKRRAAYIIEQFYAEIFRSLRQTDRLSGALIVVTSDHGESDPKRPREVIRLDSHFDEVSNIPLGIYLPDSAPPPLRERLASNLARTVANLDIAPTLADLLGLALPGGERFPGYDLFAPVPRDRVSVSVSNNEWKPWHLSAFGIACGDDRMIYHQRLGLMYFDAKADPAETKPKTSGPKFDAYRAYISIHPTLARWLSSPGSD